MPNDSDRGDLKIAARTVLGDQDQFVHLEIRSKKTADIVVV